MARATTPNSFGPKTRARITNVAKSTRRVVSRPAINQIAALAVLFAVVLLGKVCNASCVIVNWIYNRCMTFLYLKLIFLALFFKLSDSLARIRAKLELSRNPKALFLNPSSEEGVFLSTTGNGKTQYGSSLCRQNRPSSSSIGNDIALILFKNASQPRLFMI